MPRSTVVIELAGNATLARDLAAGGVFVAGCTLRMAEECELVVCTADRRVSLPARVVYVDPHRGAGLELIGFTTAMRDQLAELSPAPRAAGPAAAAPEPDDDLALPTDCRIELSGESELPDDLAVPVLRDDDDASTVPVAVPALRSADDARTQPVAAPAGMAVSPPPGPPALPPPAPPPPAPPASLPLSASALPLPPPPIEELFTVDDAAAAAGDDFTDWDAPAPILADDAAAAGNDFAEWGGAGDAPAAGDPSDWDQPGAMRTGDIAVAHNDFADDGDSSSMRPGDAAAALGNEFDDEDDGIAADAEPMLPGDAAAAAANDFVDDSEDSGELTAAEPAAGNGFPDDAGPARPGSGPRAPRNVHERLRGLNLAAQIKLASAGELHERIVLERLYGKNVWETLLRNPRLTAPEVSRIARYGALPRVLLEVILGNNAWLQVPEVRRALLTNPRLGNDQIMKVLRLTPKHELKLAAIQTAYPHAVRNAAKMLLRDA